MRRPLALEALSARQLDVARLIATGSSTREIGERLSVSPRTIETHISTIFEKLGVRTRAQVAAIVVADAGGQPHIGNVPSTLPALVGRETEVATIAALTSRHRLVTILGTGGIGKTQTAMRVASKRSNDYEDGAWFIDLLSLSSGENLAAEIARLLDISLPPVDDVLAQLVTHLRSKSALLIFDNCEHLIAPASAVIVALLRDCSGISILTTSRETLALSGERTFRLPPLDVRSAASLFVTRARAIDDRFSIEYDSDRGVDELCLKLDCIPLAIELAAARSNIFSPRQLLERLEQRFALLEGGPRDVIPRHRSMRAVIDWSYDQLDERDRCVFRRLSVFTGRFSLSYAHAVSGISPGDEHLFLDVLTSLIDKSLVVAEPDNSDLTYRLLESTRLYAHLKLEEAGEVREVTLEHIRYLTDALEAITQRVQRWMSPDATVFFDRQLGDIRAALKWALRSGEIVEGARLLAATHHLWSISSIREGIAFADDYLDALAPSECVVRAQILARLSELYWKAGDEDRSIDAAERAVGEARKGTDEATLGEALVASAVHSIMRDPELSRARLSEAEALPEMTEITRNECRYLRARQTYVSDDYELAIPMFQSLNESAKRANDLSAQAECTMVLAIIEHRAGRFERAVAIGREGVEALRDGGEPWALALSTSTLAAFLIRTDSLDEARRVALESLLLYADIDPQSPRVGTVLEIIGYVFAVEGDLVRAAQLQGLALAITAKPGTVQSKLASDMSERFACILRGSLADDEIATFRARGAKLKLEDAIALATSTSR